MNTDIFEGKSKEMRGRIKGWWGKLTDDDLEQVDGNVDQIIGLIQQKYGYTHQYAKDEFNQRMKSMEANKQRIQGKFPQEFGKVKKYFTSLEKDGAAQFKKLKSNVSQAAGKAKVSMRGTSTMIKKGVTRGLKQYNSKAQEVANQVPGNFSKRATKYPWVTFSAVLVFGFLLGNMIKPTRHYVG